MPFTANIPDANQLISASQPQIRDNFTEISTDFAQNHVQFNSGAGIAGQHSFVQLAPQAAAPAFAGVSGFWSSTATGNPIFLHNAGADINISDASFTPGTVGYFYLPCGLLIKFGTTNTDPVTGDSPIINLNIGATPHYTVAPVGFTSGTANGTGHVVLACIRTLTAVNLQIEARGSDGLVIGGPCQWLTIGH
jgi:hypothetical protein